jgi:GTP-binding protein
VLNKTDLIEDSEVKEIMKKFKKNKDSEVISLSTLNKDSISKIKAKLLSYVS